ncbi:MAG TPA: glutathione-regulated potassium-efflux system protein KefC [Burkholderiaceae bacterium]|nr:glutathione-regulated potassium-efflux system protein KefC [Burkholderiaceae bacterium]
MEQESWLISSLVFLAAGVVAVPLSRALGLGSIIGYLVAGLAIGPFGLRLVTSPQTILHFAEFGVVLMLFLVGLELEPRRLWALRRPIFGSGTVQLLGCALLIGAVAMALGVPWTWAVVAALGLSLSSTAVALQVMGERNMLSTTAGQSAFAILLLQDVAAIPILALLPILGAGEAAGGNPLFQVLRAVGVIVAIVVGGRLLLRPIFRWIAGSNTPEIFTAASLGLVLGIAALMQFVGLSMALGAFLGGVLLAESEYKRELETDVEPFKGLLLGLFFIAVGMSIDVAAVLAHPLVVLGVLFGFLLLKVAFLWVLGGVMHVRIQERPVLTLLLAQGGEFAFVVFQAAQNEGVFSVEVASVLIGAVALSMLVTPLLLVLVDRYLLPRFAALGQRAAPPELNEPQDAPIIIAGFGRYGQIIGRLLYANGLKATVLEHDAEQIEVLRRFGFKLFYGDATRLDLLRTAGAGTAQVLVLAIDDIDQSLQVADLARENFPHLTVVARARNVAHFYRLRERGVKFIERETLDSALMSARSVLELMGYQPHRARQLALRFRRHSVEQIEQAAPHYKDQKKLVSMATEGRQQLEELFAQERQAREERRREGWGQ